MDNTNEPEKKKRRSSQAKWHQDTPSAKEWQERTRAKIQASKIVDDAIKAATGKIEITNSRATMIKTLLDRTLPVQTESAIEQVTTQKPDMAALKAAFDSNPAVKEAILKMFGIDPFALNQLVSKLDAPLEDPNIQDSTKH